MIKRSFKITSETGIHARPATSLVNEAMKYSSLITLSALKKTVDFKSIMGVMALGIYTGVIIEVTCEGDDENQAIEGISKQIVSMNLGKEI